MTTFKHMAYCCTLFVFLLLAACSSPEDKKESHYLKALEYIEQEENSAAILELRNAIQIDENYADARYQLGILYLKEKDIQNAQHHLIRAADLDHDNLDASLKTAELYLITRKNEQVRPLLQRVLIKDPGNTEGLALLANLELIERNYEEALTTLQRIGADVNTSDKLLNIKGRIYAASKDFVEAEKAFEKAIGVGEDNFNNYSILLAFYHSRQETDKAEAVVSKLAEKFPDNPQTHLLMAGFHRGKGDMAGVEKDLLKVIETAPDNTRYRLMLADFYMNEGSLTQAVEILTQTRAELGEHADINAALAKLYFEQKDFDSSRQLLDEVLAENQNHGEANLLKARFLLKEQNQFEAIDILENLNKDYPKWAEPYFYLGLARLSIGQIDLAQYAVATAIEHNKTDSKSHALLAQLHLTNSDFAEAKKEAAIALRLNSANFRAASIMSKAMMGAKEFTEAIRLLSEMHKQVPDNIEVLGDLAVASIRSGDQEKGIAYLEEVLQHNPGNSKAVLLLVHLRYRNNLPAAEEFVRSQLEKASTSSGLYFLLGELLQKQKKDEEALAAYDRAVELDPDNIKAYTVSGKLLARLNKTDEAMVKYRSMIERNPKWLHGYMGMAALSESDGEVEEAMQYYRQALEIQPGFAPAANNLAWLIASTPGGDTAEALQLAMLAKQEFPTEPHIADTLGWIHYLRGSYTLAIPQFELALSEKPDDPTISYHLALALKGNRQSEKAAEILEKTLENHSSFAEREEAKALLAELAQE